LSDPVGIILLVGPVKPVERLFCWLTKPGRESARLAAGCATHLGVSAKVADHESVHHFFPAQYALPGRDSGSDGTRHLCYSQKYYVWFLWDPFEL